MVNRKRYSQEVRERAVRMVFEHEGRHSSRWETICSIASKIGCSSEALRKWVQRAEVDSGRRNGVSTNEQLAAGRLDPVLIAVFVDERDHYFGRRSSSAWVLGPSPVSELKLV